MDSQTNEVEEHSTPALPAARDPVLVLVASTELHLDAWTAKWLLQSEGIQAFLGGHAVTRGMRATDIYVLADDVAAAKKILDQADLWHASTWVT